MFGILMGMQRYCMFKNFFAFVTRKHSNSSFSDDSKCFQAKYFGKSIVQFTILGEVIIIFILLDEFVVEFEVHF